MYSVPPALTPLRTALRTAIPDRVHAWSDECALAAGTGTAESEASSVQPATRGLDRFEPETYPPYETVEVGPAVPDAPMHGVVVWNDGPKRTLSLSAESAGSGAAFAGSRLVAAGGVVRLALGRPDRYEVTVAAPGRPRYGIEIEPEWFETDASVTNVRVGGDGYVRYDVL